MSILNFLSEMGHLQNHLGELVRMNSCRKRLHTAFLPGISQRHFPMLNVSSDEQQIFVTALAPGLDTSTIIVKATQGRVTISGEKSKVDPEKNHRSERPTGKFTRDIALPLPIDPDQVKAEYTNGILKIILPKIEKAKPRQIEIKID